MTEIFNYPTLESTQKEMTKSPEDIEDFIREFRMDLMDWNKHALGCMGDRTSESVDDDMEYAFEKQTVEEAWMMCAEDHLENIKEAVKKRIKDKEIFERMSKEELAEYKRVEKELKQQEVINEL